MSDALAPCVRFAPSPTGFLHLGNARTAVLNWLFARSTGARFLLRLDDTDQARSEARYTQALLEDLAWLGLSYDGFVRQSERTALYAEKVAFLKEQGRLYPCYESASELEVKRKLQLSQGNPPTYDRAALALSQAQRGQLESQGRKPHWRFFLEEGTVSWMDLMRGPLQYDIRTLSDPIVVREDGTVGFLLAGAIDDQDLGVTHILRGEDHITNTAVQIQLLQALRVDPARFSFGHFSLITDAQGHGFSKRLGSLSLQELRQQGMLPLAVCSFLMALGTAEGPQVAASLDALVKSFSLEKYSRATPKLDIRALWELHAKFLHQLSFDQALPLLREKGLEEGTTPLFWEVVRESLSRLEEISVWKEVCGLTPFSSVFKTGESMPADFWRAAQQVLPPDPWSVETWGEWTQQLKEITGYAGKKLYLPLREALTGQAHGPEMKKLLRLIPRRCVVERLLAQESLKSPH